MKHVLANRRHSRRIRSVANQIGNTPLVKIRNITRDLPKTVEVHAKLEYLNPGGSVNDRTAWQIIRDAIADGRLTHGKTLLDATYGNTGVAYAMLGAALGHDVTLVMPESITAPRRALIGTYGARIILTDAVEGCDGARRVACRIAEEDAASGDPRYFFGSQSSNPSNPKAHYQTTGPEIWEATRHKVTHLVAGMGTSGTLMGTGRRLKGYNPEIEIVAVEPDKPEHGLDGLRHMASSMQPEVYNPSDVDRRVEVDTESGRAMTERLALEEGIFVGLSSGGVLAGAMAIAQRLDKGVIVAIFPDHADRYV